MFNNFVKSMMALCMVTSGWSSNGIDGRDYLAPSGGVTEVAPGSGPITAVGNDDKSPLDGGKSPRKVSDDSVQSKTSHEISSQEEPTSDGAANTSTSSDEGTSPQKEGGVVVGATPMNDVIGDPTADKNPEIKMSNSSEMPVETVDVGKQTIEEEKSQSTTSETMNKSINTVGTLEIEGHSSGEEGGSGSDNFHYNKDADTSTFSEEATETEVGSIVDDKVDGLDVRDKISDLVNVISAAYRRSQRGQNHDYCEQRIREAINELYDIKAISTNLPESYDLFLALHLSSQVWENEKSLEHISSEIVRIAENYGFQSGNVLDAISVILKNLRD